MPFNVDFIINTATKLNTKPPINKAGTCFIRGSGLKSNAKIFSLKLNHSPTEAAQILDIAIGAIYLTEKCLKIDSCAKITPAMGA